MLSQSWKSEREIPNISIAILGKRIIIKACMKQKLAFQLIINILGGITNNLKPRFSIKT